jgi:hypothetical protein
MSTMSTIFFKSCVLLSKTKGFWERKVREFVSIVVHLTRTQKEIAAGAVERTGAQGLRIHCTGQEACKRNHNQSTLLVAEGAKCWVTLEGGSKGAEPFAWVRSTLESHLWMAAWPSA